MDHDIDMASKVFYYLLYIIVYSQLSTTRSVTYYVPYILLTAATQPQNRSLRSASVKPYLRLFDQQNTKKNF